MHLKEENGPCGVVFWGAEAFPTFYYTFYYILSTKSSGSTLAECSSGGSEAFPMFVRECGDTHSRHFPCLCARSHCAGEGMQTACERRRRGSRGQFRCCQCYVGGSGARVDNFVAVSAM